MKDLIKNPIENMVEETRVEPIARQTFVHFKIWKRWLQYRLRGYSLENPFELLTIPPEMVEYTIASFELPHDMPKYGIIDGDWDMNNRNIADSPIYNMFYEHFINEVPWKKTARYQNLIHGLKNGKKIKSFSGKQTETAYKEYLTRWDEIYEEIKNEGYKTQAELRRGTCGFFRPNNPLDEINVFISRKGDFICRSGKHRVIAAQLLGLESIPVYVRIRHKQWQAIREYLLSQPDESSVDAYSHPDIYSLKNKYLDASV